MHLIHVTTASEILRIALEPRRAKAAVSRHLNVRQDLVSRWTKGERKPSTPLRARIQAELGIDWRLWDERAMGDVSDRADTHDAMARVQALLALDESDEPASERRPDQTKGVAS